MLYCHFLPTAILVKKTLHHLVPWLMLELLNTTHAVCFFLVADSIRNYQQRSNMYLLLSAHFLNTSPNTCTCNSAVDKELPETVGIKEIEQHESSQP